MAAFFFVGNENMQKLEEFVNETSFATVLYALSTIAKQKADALAEDGHYVQSHTMLRNEYHLRKTVSYLKG